MNRPRSGWSIGLALALAGLVLVPGPVQAQERSDSRPLTKSELVRLLVDSSLDQGEIARVVRRVCLTFEPSEEDFADLERAGAGPAVLARVRECSRRERPVQLSWSSSRGAGRAGETVIVEARAQQGSDPADGVRLVVEEGSEALASGRTDADGRVRFRLPSGTTVGSRRLRLRAPGVRTSGRPPVLTLDVRPGPPAGASLQASGGTSGTSPAEIAATVEDAFGNPVPGAEIHLTSDSAGGNGDVLRLRAETGPGGEATFRLPGSRPARGARLLLIHQGDTLTSAPEPSRLARAGERGPGTDDGPGDGDPGQGEPSGEGSDASGGTESGSGRSVDEAISTGQLDLERDRPLDAVQWFRRAVERRPASGPAWSGLGRAWLAAGEPALAREALRTGRWRAADSSAVNRVVEAMGGLPPWGEIRVFGGGGWRGQGSEGFGALELRARPTPGFAFWAAFESALLSDYAALVRGSSDVASTGGGVAVSYGPDRLMTTSFSASLLDYGTDLREMVYRLGNELRLSGGGRPIRLRIDGTLGRWWDRDDWLISTEVKVPVAGGVSLVPAVHVGETSGSDLSGVGRRPASERRGALSVRVEPRGGWIVEPTVAYARVSPLSPSTPDDDGENLLEGRLRLTIPLAPSASILVRGRHQNPPFADAFTDGAVGLSYSFR